MKVEVEYPGLCKERAASGKTRWRVRVAGNKSKKTTIPVGPKHKDFLFYYEAAREGQKVEAPPRPDRGFRRGSLSDLCARYVEWMQGQVASENLSPKTYSSRERGLRHACNIKGCDETEVLGKYEVDLPREAFVHIVDEFGARTGAAETCLKALRAAYKWGAERGLCKQSHIFGVSAKHKPGGGATPWSSDDIEAFLSCHGPGTMARLWLCLVDVTAGRIGDTPLLGPNHEEYHDGIRHIEWQPPKKGLQTCLHPCECNVCARVAASRRSRNVSGNRLWSAIRLVRKLG